MIATTANPRRTGPSGKKHSALEKIYPTDEDGEKQGKLNRSDNKQLTNVFIFLGTLCTVFLLAIVKLKHSPQNTLRGLRHTSSFPNHIIQGEATSLPPNSIYRVEVQGELGLPFKLNQFAGMVSLVVNVACKWGKTDISYRQLSELQEKFGEQGFTVLAFPSNDYGQEFPENRDIQKFIQTNYPQVTFPVLGTSHLPENPVYQLLQQQMPGFHVKHNFYKYLINRQGIAVKFFDKKTNPRAIQNDIEELLSAPSNAVTPQKFVIH